MTDKSITEYITKYIDALVNNNIELNIKESIDELNLNESKYFITDDFINDIIEFINEDKCCVPFYMLYKYKVLNINITCTQTFTHFYDIHKFYEKYNLYPQRDYCIRSPSDKNKWNYDFKNGDIIKQQKLC